MKGLLRVVNPGRPKNRVKQVISMNNIIINTEQVKTYYDTVWPIQETGLFAVSSKGPNGLSTKFFKHPVNIERVCGAVERWKHQDVWACMGCIGQRPDKGRGSEKDVIAIPGLWFDLDCKEGHHNKNNLPSKDEALAFLNEIPFKTSMLVWSGGGFQVYWLYKEPLEDPQKAKELSQRFHAKTIGMGKAHGWSLDNTSDNVRLLRLPGSFNHKGSPVQVKILELNNYRYQPEAFEEFLIDEQPQNEAQRPGVGSIDSLPYSVKHIIKNGVEKGERSDAIGSVLSAMVKAGVPEADIISTFEAEAIGEKYHEKGSGRVKWLKDEISRARQFVGMKNNNTVNEKNEENELNEIENRIWQKWPELDNQTLAGFAGRFVKLATKSSEADKAAVLITFLMRFGVEVGPDVYLRIGDAKHFSRSMAVIVGNSSKARKGTSGKPVGRLFKMGLLAENEIYIPASWSPGPLSSGEGLIYAVRDEVTTWKVDKKTGQGEEIVIDPGINDKRLFVMDEEFSSCLIASRRDGNTLSTILRSMWDSGNLEPLTKNNRIKASGSHIGIVSHITLAELNRKLEDTEAFSGFANRILWVCARRQGFVPFPQPMPETELAAFQRELKDLIKKCQGFKEMVLSGDARKMWTDVYRELSKDHSGLVGAVINRAESQALRLAMIYALLDASDLIEVNHLESALAMWRYCEQSARFIFGGREINPYAQKTLDLLRDQGEMTTKDIYDAFSRNITKHQMEEAITELMSQKKIEVEKIKQDGRGRPKTVFRYASGPVRDDSLDFSF